MIGPEQEAIHADAECRLRELRLARARLLPNLDDAEVLSEYVSVVGAIEQAEAARAAKNQAAPR